MWHLRVISIDNRHNFSIALGNTWYTGGQRVFLSASVIPPAKFTYLVSRVQNTFERPPKMFLLKTGMCNSIDFDISQRFYQSNFLIWSHLACAKCIWKKIFFYINLSTYAFIKIAITLDLVMRFGCPLGFSIS